MLVTIYTDGWFLSTTEVNLSTQGQRQVIDLGVAGQVDVVLGKRRDWNYVRPPGSLDTLLSDVGSEFTYNISYFESPAMRCRGFTLKYTDSQTNIEYDPYHSETQEFPYSQYLSGTIEALDFTCENNTVRKYTLVGESSVKYEYQGTRDRAQIIIELVTKEYTLTYNANGGVGVPPRRTFSMYDRIDIPRTYPTRNRYTFLGYDENKNTKNPTYTPTGLWSIYSAPGRNITLYAIWKTNFTYLPMYNTANGKLLRGVTHNLLIRDGDES